MTTAEYIATLLGDDGQTFRAPGGISLEQLAAQNGASRETEKELTRWVFPDGSAITAFPASWDIGYSDCWCWSGDEHRCYQDDCDSNPQPQETEHATRETQSRRQGTVDRSVPKKHRTDRRRRGSGTVESDQVRLRLV